MEASSVPSERPGPIRGSKAEDSLGVATLLSLAGGFLDAFTWLAHGGVFANAQTGNIVLLGLFSALGKWPEAVRHIPPIAAFTVGVFIASRMLAPLFSLVVEILLLLIVTVLPPGFPDVVVTVGISFTAALQTSSFKTVEGSNYSSVMTTGNLRHSVEALTPWGDSVARRRACVLATVCVTFCLGAAIGAFATARLGNLALFIPAGLLSTVLWLCRDFGGLRPAWLRRIIS
jgi:uncharacterized membrane protein YoaK (UPF0700 family)